MDGSTQGWPLNVRLFTLFRILFNARFYYAVYAVLFLDFGLSVEQFALLNGVWAITIVLLEVPSGALADRIGQKAMLVLAAILMVAEFIVIGLAPTTGGPLVFWLFFINRILSGAAEAAASGADESIAYDSLPAEGREKAWAEVTSRAMRWQSAAFVVALLVGAAVYDAHFMNSLWQGLGFSGSIEKSLSIRFPLWLNIGTALLVLAVALRFKPNDSPHYDEKLGSDLKATFVNILEAGRWIWATPAAFVLLLIGFCYDSIVRLFLTIGSNYYRLLEFPEASFGLIGMGIAILGIFTPTLGRWLLEHFRPTTNFRFIGVAIALSLASLLHPIPYYGLVFLLPLWTAMGLVHYFLSNYLNLLADSRHRTTVLSFRGLSMNLAYGTLTTIYGVLTGALQRTRENHFDDIAALEQSVFATSLQWFLGYFLASTLVVYLVARWRLPQKLDPALRKSEIEPGD